MTATAMGFNRSTGQPRRAGSPGTAARAAFGRLSRRVLRFMRIILLAIIYLLIGSNSSMRASAQAVGDRVILYGPDDGSIPVHPADQDRHYTRWSPGTYATVVSVGGW